MLAHWNVHVGTAAARQWKDVPCSPSCWMLFWPVVCELTAHSLGPGTFSGGASWMIDLSGQAVKISFNQHLISMKSLWFLAGKSHYSSTKYYFKYREQGFGDTGRAGKW